MNQQMWIEATKAVKFNPQQALLTALDIAGGIHCVDCMHSGERASYKKECSGR